MYWIKVLLNDQQSGVINGGFTTPYFNLKKGASQGDLISKYLYMLTLEVPFELGEGNLIFCCAGSRVSRSSK